MPEASEAFELRDSAIGQVATITAVFDNQDFGAYLRGR